MQSHAKEIILENKMDLFRLSSRQGNYLMHKRPWCGDKDQESGPRNLTPHDHHTHNYYY